MDISISRKSRFWALPVTAAILSCSAPAYAESTDDTAQLRAELAQMRAQMSAMATRIDTLEGELAKADAKADAATKAASDLTAAAAKAPTPATMAGDGSARMPAVSELNKNDGWSFKPRGRVQMDIGSVSAGSAISLAANAQNPNGLGFASEFRRIYLGADGTLPGGFGYRLEADFANSDVTLTDVYLTYDATKHLRLTLGQQKPFWGLEELTSDLFTSFMERTSFGNAFGFERRLGFSAAYNSGPILLQAGAFTDDAQALLDDAANGYSFDGRAVFMPQLAGGQFHLGGSVHYRKLNNTASSVSYGVRAFVHTSDTKFITTGSISGVDSETGYGLELAYLRGPFHVAGETHWQHVGRLGGLPEPTFFGGYAEVGYYLTGGDRRGYKGGVFDRTKPAHPLGKGGLGALELNLRYDYLDLVDAGIVGGTQNTYGVALVWVPTDYTRFILNYGHVVYDRAAIHAGALNSYAVDAFGMRAQFDF